MFGNMMGDMEERQKALKGKLAELMVEAEVEDGAIKVQANANREITNISIDRTRIDWEDTEQVEDLLMVAINRVLDLAAEREAEETQNLIKDMLPPGLDGLAGMFGQ